MTDLARLSNEALLQSLHRVASSHRRVTVELVLHLAEFDTRRLAIGKGFPSLFAYTVDQLHFSEDEACRRIDAARLVRAYPAAVPLLESGALTLSVLCSLKPHLTPANHGELLAGTSGCTVRRAREWLAARFPEADVPDAVRKLPARHVNLVAPPPPPPPPPPPQASLSLPPAAFPFPTSQASLSLPPAPFFQSAPVAPLPPLTSLASLSVQPAPSLQLAPSLPPAPSRVTLASPSHRSSVEPLSAERFLVKFTASRALRDKLEFARDLLRHANPRGELAVVIERALDLLVADLEKKRHGKIARPQTASRGYTTPSADTAHRRDSAHVGRAARRDVIHRDGPRCSFVSADGRRCGARAFIEFDHVVPRGKGGDSFSPNLRLLCRAHNRFAAERIYGAPFVAAAVARTR